MKKIELRAMPALEEKRNALLDEMETIVKTGETETRAMNEAETARFTEIEAEIRSIDATLKAQKTARAMVKTVETGSPEVETRAADEAKFLKYLQGETRALDISTNGAIIPSTIANRIIETVKDLCPIYKMATVFNVAGDLVFPVYDETTPIAAAYVADGSEVTAAAGNFTSVTLTNFIAGALAKVSKSLMNRTDFDLVSYVVKKVAEAIAEFLGKELIVGTTSKMTGVLSSTNGITTASATAIAADELIGLQDTVPDAFQDGCVWIMSKATRTMIRKLKDGNGNYFMNKDITTGFKYELLGKPVYIDKNMPAATAGLKSVFYGDPTGLYVKLSKAVDIQILLEKYAEFHQIGVIGYVEADSKIVEPQKLAVMTMHA